MDAQTATIVIAVVVLVAVVTWYEATILAELNRATQFRYLPREAWLILCIFMVPIGGILYLMYGKVR